MKNETPLSQAMAVAKAYKWAILAVALLAVLYAFRKTIAKYAKTLASKVS